MHPANHAQTTPDRAAFVMADSGESVTYRQLDERSNQGAHLFRTLGLKSRDVVAILLENHPRYLEVAWAAQRAGLYYTCISAKLNAVEIEYILTDCGARALVTSSAMEEVLDELANRFGGLSLFIVGEGRARFRSYEAERAGFPATPIGDQTAGSDMLYTSGTTGRPKGVKPAPIGGAFDGETRLETVCRNLFGFEAGCVYLCPAPLYHSAPLRLCMSVQRLGGTVVVMERFDAEAALALIEKHRIDCAQFVPTHFIRMLKLPADTRGRYEVSSLKSVIHASAPCPVPVKEAMIAWWGPVINEYYSGTEGNGMCYISAHDWLSHKGSVGKAVVGVLHICDDAGDPLPPRTEGLVYFEGGSPISYHNDPQKTSDIYNKHGWMTLGDVGWVDEEGYLCLTDRRSFMIISGGVNIYPQEIENLLVGHPKIADVAIVGAPHEEMGEQVVAVVQPAPGVAAGPELADEVLAFARANLSHVKVPRRVDFMDELPRQPSGKLFKRLIRDAYWERRPIEDFPATAKKLAPLPDKSCEEHAQSRIAPIGEK
jgi:long-chain acyl-CoA synthetase